jgi:hypothetical protein
MKKIRNALCIAMMLLVLLVPSVMQTQAADMFFNIDGLLEGFKVQPVNKEGTVMAEMYDLLKKLGATVEWKDSARTATAVRADKRIVLIIDNKKAVVNGVEQTMPQAPFYKDGNIMVPVRFVCTALGAEVSWDAATKTISIKTGRGGWQVIDVNKAATSDPILMSYEQALESAYKANSSVLNLSESVDYLNEQHSEIQRSMQDINAAIAAGGLAIDNNLDQQYVNALRGLKNIDDTMQNIPLNQQMVRESTEYMLRSSIAAIAGGNMDAQLLQATIELQNQNVKNLKLKRDLGMASENEVKAAQQAHDQSKASLDALLLNIKGEKSGLSKIVMQPLSKEVIVQYEPSLSTVSLPSLDQLINTAVQSDPTLLLKKTALDEAQYALDSFQNPLAESKLQLQNNLTAASRAYEDARRNLESAIRSTYTSVGKLQENTKALRIDLDKAHDDYNTLAINYQAGLVTAYDLDSAKVGVLKAEIALSKNTYSYWVLFYGLQHPFLLVNASQ